MIKEEGESIMGNLSKRNSSKYQKDSELSDELKLKGKQVRQCMSDIVNEHDFGHWEGGSAWEGLSEEEERKNHSDIHEMFFVNEIFKDDLKFDKLMRKIERGYSTSSVSSMSKRSDISDSSKSGSSNSSSSERDDESSEKSQKSGIKEEYDEENEDFESESYGDQDEEDAYGDEDDEQEDEEEILTMDRVRFNSLCILPSQIECCSLDY